ncbi:MAG: hypothetical protein P8Y24_05780 [Gammaproteobacteria bacterium]
MSDANRIIRISGCWYIETRTGHEGPFDDTSQARQFLALLRNTEAARNECAGLPFIYNDG